MAISVTHTFVSTQAQSADPNKVSKNEWNAAHTISMATGKLLGRTTATAGPFEEITADSADFLLDNGALALSSGDITVLSSDFDGSDVNTAQPVFAAAQDVFTAEASTAYEFEAFYHIARTAGANAHTTSILFGGGATYTSVRYMALTTNPAGNTLSATSSIIGDVATEVVVTASSNSTTENITVRLVGIMRVDTGGTVIPQFKYSAAPGGAPKVKANSFFRMRKLGISTLTVGGAWT